MERSLTRSRTDQNADERWRRLAVRRYPWPTRTARSWCTASPPASGSEGHALPDLSVRISTFLDRRSESRRHLAHRGSFRRAPAFARQASATSWTPHTLTAITSSPNKAVVTVIGQGGTSGATRSASVTRTRPTTRSAGRPARAQTPTGRARLRRAPPRRPRARLDRLPHLRRLPRPKVRATRGKASSRSSSSRCRCFRRLAARSMPRRPRTTLRGRTDGAAGELNLARAPAAQIDDAVVRVLSARYSTSASARTSCSCTTRRSPRSRKRSRSRGARSWGRDRRGGRRAVRHPRGARPQNTPRPDPGARRQRIGQRRTFGRAGSRGSSGILVPRSGARS